MAKFIASPIRAYRERTRRRSAEYYYKFSPSREGDDGAFHLGRRVRYGSKVRVGDTQRLSGILSQSGRLTSVDRHRRQCTLLVHRVVLRGDPIHLPEDDIAPTFPIPRRSGS